MDTICFSSKLPPSGHYIIQYEEGKGELRMRIFWGDIHNHNEIGYGKGSLERSFDIAGNLLDFYAFTPHTWWPDLPDNDDAVKRHHLEGFKKVEGNWTSIKEVVRKRYAEGKFVTLLAWEWHSLAWGDYCVYFPGDDDEFTHAVTLVELKKYAREHNAIIIPHHVAYRKGWRGVDWNEFDESCSPVVEIFSEHGNSFEASTHFGMYSHSMGGVDSDQTALSNLKKGRRFGFIACTDDHYGCPGGFGHGITAVLAETLDRKSIFNAIKKRHTYAATGDRIKMSFDLNGGMMGDVVESVGAVRMSFDVEARDKLQSIEIFKNGELFATYSTIDFASRTPDPEKHLIKIEWGWDMIASKEITKWKMKVRCENGRVENLIPAFCGGSASAVEMNTITELSDGSWSINSYTSRKNAHPVNFVTFFLSGDMNAAIHLDVEIEHEDVRYERQIIATKLDLLEKDVYSAAFDKFSSPKIKVHALIPSNEYAFNSELMDEPAKTGDFYYLKATQRNGQMAWSSPIWIG